MHSSRGSFLQTCVPVALQRAIYRAAVFGQPGVDIGRVVAGDVQEHAGVIVSCGKAAVLRSAWIAQGERS